VSSDAHPLDIEIVELAEHLAECSLCRLKFWRALYGGDRLEADA
jgi:hypothetical protein